jgi:hypothetical protein
LADFSERHVVDCFTRYRLDVKKFLQGQAHRSIEARAGLTPIEGTRCE